MRRQISTKDTFFYKIILPGILVISAAVIPAALYLDNNETLAFLDPDLYANGKNGQFVAAVFLFAFLFGAAVLLFLMTKASKKVSLDGDTLYVSNYIREIAIPVSNIEKIIWFSPMRPAMIYLKERSKLGKKINFSPNVQGKDYFGSNPIVDELRALAGLDEKGLPR